MSCCSSRVEDSAQHRLASRALTSRYCGFSLSPSRFRPPRFRLLVIGAIWVQVLLNEHIFASSDGSIYKFIERNTFICQLSQNNVKKFLSYQEASEKNCDTMCGKAELSGKACAWDGLINKVQCVKVPSLCMRDYRVLYSGDYIVQRVAQAKKARVQSTTLNSAPPVSNEQPPASTPTPTTTPTTSTTAKTTTSKFVSTKNKIRKTKTNKSTNKKHPAKHDGDRQISMTAATKVKFSRKPSNSTRVPIKQTRRPSSSSRDVTAKAEHSSSPSPQHNSKTTTRVPQSSRTTKKPARRISNHKNSRLSMVTTASKPPLSLIASKKKSNRTAHKKPFKSLKFNETDNQLRASFATKKKQQPPLHVGIARNIQINLTTAFDEGDAVLTSLEASFLQDDLA